MTTTPAPLLLRGAGAVLLLATLPFLYFTGLFIPAPVTWVCMAITVAVSAVVLLHPRLSARDAWFMVAGTLAFSALVVFAGPPVFGWSAYTPPGR